MRFTLKTSVVALGQLATSIERTLVVVVLSRTLAKSDYGTYQQVWLFYGLVLPVFTLGLPSSVLYFIPRAEPGKQKTVAFQTMLLLEAVGVLFSVATLLTAPWVAQQFNNPGLVDYLRVFCVYPLLALPPKLVNLLMIAEDRPILAALVSGLTAITTLLSLTLPAILGLPLIFTFYSANLGALLLLVGVLFSLSHFYSEQHFQPNLPLLWRQLVYAIPLGVAGLLGIASKQLNKAVVSSLFPPETYAVYANGAFEIPFIGLITGSLMSVLIPEFVTRLQQGDSNESVWELWNAATERVAMLLFPIAVLLFLFAPEFIVAMFSPKYIDSSPVFRIYLGLAVLRITQYGALLQALGRTRLILATSVLGLSFNLAMSWLLAREVGLLGPAWANVITTYLWALTYLVMISRLLKTPFRKVMPWKRLGWILACAVVAGLIARQVRMLPLQHLGVLLTGSTVYGVGYVAILLATGTLTTQQLYPFFTKTMESLRSRLS